MKVVTVVGARPQFVKAAPVSRELARAKIHEVMVHTGQHYDHLMSQVFFDSLKMPRPKHELHVGSGAHGAQTGEMLARIENVLMEEQPAWVMVYGDTNSTLAGALAASKLHIPIAHVEAGLRSFNRRMPEEINRVITDHLSELLFAPSLVAVENLHHEGIVHGIHQCGDVMYDAAMEHREIAKGSCSALEVLGLTSGNYLLVTVHRAENTDSDERLGQIVKALEELSADERVVWPVHPRTRRYIDRIGLRETPNLILMEPAPYLDMLQLEAGARVVLTDSGGVQKEAQWFEVPCVTLRDETEWVETVECGWNNLAGTDPNKIVRATRNACRPPTAPCYATPGAARSIVRILADKTVNSHIEEKEVGHESMDRQSIRDHASASRSDAAL